MIRECIAIEDLEPVVSSPADDPRRQHARECPACGALFASYQAFVSARVTPGADPAAAEARLEAFIQDRAGRASSPHAYRWSRPRRAWFARPVFRFGFAAVVVLVAAVAVLRRPGSDEVVLRGDARPRITLEAPRVNADRSVVLAWSAVPGATSYRVTFLSDSLEEVGATVPADGTTLTVSPVELDGATGSARFWQVTAYAGGDAIATSAPAPVRP